MVSVLSRGRALWLGPVVAALVAAGAGCGKKGRPLPPLPRGPFAVREVLVRQLGTAARVECELPAPRGQAPAEQPVRLELLRVADPPGTTPAESAGTFQRRGEIVTTLDGDPLAAERRAVLDDPLAGFDGGIAGWTVRYAVRVLDRRGRPSPLVVTPPLELLPPGNPPAGLAAEPTDEGVRLRWSAPAGSPEARFRLYRRAPGTAWPSRPLDTESLDVTSYLDAAVVTGRAYEYQVRPVLDPGRPWREGPPSSTVAVVAEDRFPPDPPGNLVAVQERLAVRLFWDPNRERDVAGYQIERRRDEGPWQPIGPSLVEQPLYLDAGVEAGQRYAYRVTALDRARPPNRSEPSEPVAIEVRPEPVEEGR